MAADMPGARQAEAGFSLLEMTIAAALLMLISSAALALLATGQRNQDYVGRRGQSQDSARVALNRVTRDLRQLTAINSVLPVPATCTGSPPVCSVATLDVQTYTPASPTAPVRVVWSTLADGTGTYTLRRALGPGTPTPVPMLYGLESASVFSWAPGDTGTSASNWPYRINVALSLAESRPTAHFALSSDVELRNVQIPQPPA